MKAAILAQVAPLVQSPRKGVLELMEVAANISDTGLIGMEVWAQHMVTEHPRYPVAISVDVRYKRARIIELMRLAEMTDDTGIRTLLQKAIEKEVKYPRHPLTIADIVQLPKRPASKGRKARAAP